jgi:GR25 family glycosyltransferase involved in LPS biosynthesis
MKQKFKYYIIHNLEVARYENTIKLLSKYGVDIKDVTFINHPNKNELTYDIKKKSVQKNSKIKDGWISCSYKHYLALEMIVNNQDDFAVIMEDNIGDFIEDIPIRLNRYLNELPEEWDVVYDSVWGDYEAMNEEVLDENKLVYTKSNDITKNIDGKIISHGGTRAAQFYFVNQKSAKKLYDNFLPFNHSADMWMNDVLRKINAKSFWAEPSLVVSKYNIKTSTNLNFIKDFFYIIKSKIINFRLKI